MSAELKIRILSGEAVVRAGKLPSGMNAVHEHPALRLEANVAPAARADLGNGRAALLFGRLLGRRDAEGVLVTGAAATELAALATQSPAQWAAAREGRYIVAIVNGGTCNVFADRFGKIDLFLQEGAGGTAVATDLSLLPESPGKAGFDQAALAHTLTYYGHRPPKRHTIYQGVQRLGVGDVAILDGRCRIERSAFKPVRSADYSERDHDRYADLFLSFLKSAGSDAGNVVYLSSGWDSTSILAGLVHLFGAGKVRAFIGRMHYSERSGICNQFEIDRASKMAAHYGVQLDIVEFDYARKGPPRIEQAAPLFKRHQYQSLTGLNHLSLADGVRSAGCADRPVFAGEISDGAHNLGFSQYVSLFHPSYEFREYADKMSSYLFGPTYLREVLAGRGLQDAVYSFFRGRSGDTKFDAPESDASASTRRMFVDFFLRNGRRPFWSIDNEPLLTKDGARLYTETMTDQYLADTAKATPEELYSWYLHLYNSFHWQGSTVATLQTTAAHLGIEAHLPYWDGGLQDFLSAMPESWGRGLDFNSTKYPLKWMLKNRVPYPYHLQTGPHSYTYDVDPRFNHGEEFMCHSSVTPVAQATLAKRPYREILSDKTFDLTYIDGLVDEFVGNRMTAGARLNHLISVYLLCQSGWYA